MTVQESTNPVGAFAVEAPNGQPLNVLNVLIGILIRPSATFKSLREMRQSYWWLAFLITVAALLLYTAVSASVTSRMMPSFTPPAGAITAGDTISAAPQVAQPSSSFIMVVIPLAAGIGTILLGYAFRSLVAFGASLVMGGHSTFKQTFRMAVWTTLPLAIRHLIQSIAVTATQGRIISGLSGVMTMLETRNLPFLSTLLGQIDFYTVWSLVLLGIGISVTTRLGKGKSAIAVLMYVAVCVAGFLIFYLAGNALGGLGGGLQGPGMIRGPRG